MIADELDATTTPPDVDRLVRRLQALQEHLRHQPLTHADAVDIETIGEAATALASERAAHAETKRERDEARTKAGYWQAEYLNACRDASSFSDDLVRAEAALAEARKALEQAEQQLDYGQVDAAHQILIRAARRVREGGEANG